MLTPYQFASNTPIMAIDLDGLEAKIAISGSGDGDNYTQSDIYAFDARAKVLEEKHGFKSHTTSSGKGLLEILRSETLIEGSILHLVHFAHGSNEGLFLDRSSGFYRSESEYVPGSSFTTSRTVNDLVAAISNEDILFEENAIWVFGSCHACYNKGYEGDVAFEITLKTGVTTIGATGFVMPEIAGGRETGRLTSTGKFIKVDKVYDVTFWDEDDNILYSKTVSTESEVSALKRGYDPESDFTMHVIERIETSDLGEVINPSDY